MPSPSPQRSGAGVQHCGLPATDYATAVHTFAHHSTADHGAWAGLRHGQLV
jgi:hypothetical protein